MSSSFLVYFALSVVLGCSTTYGRTVSEISNPVVDFSACGRSVSSFICDPDRILTFAEGIQLDNVISDIVNSTACPCSTVTCVTHHGGYRIGIALVDRMQQDASVLVSGAPGSSASAAQEMNLLLQQAKRFAYSLLSDWSLSRCGDAILIFYSRLDSVYYTATGDAVSKILTSDVIGEISVNARSFFPANISTGLQKILVDYKLVLLGKYNRTTSLQRSDGSPETAKVITSLANSDISRSLLLIFLSAVVNLLYYENFSTRNSKCDSVTFLK